MIYVAIEREFQILKIDLEEKRVEVEFAKSHRDNIFALKIFQNGLRLISGSADQRILIWSTQNGQILGEFYGGTSSPV